MKVENWDKRIYRFSDNGWLTVEDFGKHKSYELAIKSPFLNMLGKEQLTIMPLTQEQFDELRLAFIMEGENENKYQEG